MSIANFLEPEWKKVANSTIFIIPNLAPCNLPFHRKAFIRLILPLTAQAQIPWKMLVVVHLIYAILADMAYN